MMEIVIDDNFFAVPKMIIIGNSGEIASRKIKFKQPEVQGADYYIVRFSMPKSDMVFETAIVDGILTVPAVVLHDMGIGYMQWIARNISGQLIAKSDLISYSVLRSVGDEVSPLPAPEDTESAIQRIDAAAQAAINSILSNNVANEVIAARRCALSDTTCENLSQRLIADFESMERKCNENIESALGIIENELSEVVDLENGIIDNNGILHIRGDGSVKDNEYEKRTDFQFADIYIAGNVGISAFKGCTELNSINVNCTKICDNAFYGCPKLNSITIGKTVTEIGSGIISNCAFYIPNGVRVMYSGTVAEWAAINKSSDWVGSQTVIENGMVICTDGTAEVA